MQSKPNRLLQIATLAFALSMLATYMVYSQLQRTRVAPAGSASAATNGLKGKVQSQGQSTNRTPQARTLVVAPSSKVRAPLLDLPAPFAKPMQPTAGASSRGVTIAPGSKSAPVFDLREYSQAQKPKAMSAKPRHTTNTSTNPNPAH
jgi:hypothetical protein